MTSMAYYLLGALSVLGLSLLSLAVLKVYGSHSRFNGHDTPDKDEEKLP